MFERYSEKARRVIFFARYEASQFGPDAINAEHLLLGLLRESTPRLAELLGAPLETIRQQVEAGLTQHPKIPTSVDLPLTKDAKRVLECAAEESKGLGKQHVGIEHLLLGLLGAKDSPTATILGSLGLKIDEVRIQIALAESKEFEGPSRTPINFE